MDDRVERRTRRRFWIWMVGLTVPVVIAVVVAAQFRPNYLLARHWRAQLYLLPEAEVAVQLRQIAELDDAGTAVLVEALGSERTCVAVNACATLNERMDFWARLPADQAVRHVAVVARQLAAQAGRWGPSSRRMANELAVRILHWPVENDTDVAIRLVADCERVLRLSAGNPSGEARIASRASGSNRTERPVSHQLPEQATLTDGAGMPVAALPGGGLPVDEVELPPLPPSLFGPPQPRLVEDDDQPQLMPPFGKLLPRVIFPENEVPDPYPEPRMPTIAVPRPAEPRELSPDRGAEQTSGLTTPATAYRAAAPRELPLELTLIRLLADTDSQVVQEATDQLRLRGFRNVDLALARKMASPVPVIRRHMAESLIRQSSMPGRWLIWLSYDPDAGVRKAVVSMMATTRDPDVHRRLSAMLLSEVDNDVRAQLEKVIASSSVSQHGSR